MERPVSHTENAASLLATAGTELRCDSKRINLGTVVQSGEPCRCFNWAEQLDGTLASLNKNGWSFNIEYDKYKSYDPFVAIYW